MSIVKEFREFAVKGNVVDLAVGVIIGAAFGTIIKSLVDNIIMPVISLVIPGQDSYKDWEWVITSHVDEHGVMHVDKGIPYGHFLADVVNFIIVAFVLFIFIKKFLAMILKDKAAAPPAPTKDQELLTEIRDLLKQRTT